MRLRKTSALVGRLEGTLSPNGRARLAYIVLKKHQGLGYAKEGTAGVVEYLFGRRDCSRVAADMEEANAASWKLARGLGFRRRPPDRCGRLYELRKSELAARGLKLRAEKKLEASRTVLAWRARLKSGDAKAQYQCAWAHDLLGLEREAIPFYERALKLGLAGKDREGALLGLGSSLRCIGRVGRAVAVLRKGVGNFPRNRALKAFLALALQDGKNGREALGIVLKELGETSADPGIRRYRRALLGYARELTGP